MDELVSDAMEFESRLTDELEELSQYPELQAEQEDLTMPLTLAQIAKAYLERVALYSDLDQADESDAVSLMTIHSAKGLEFDTVFLVGANEGLFPGEQSLYSREEIEEERRLAYVALTRAKRRLFITAARQRLLYGQTMYQKVSRFAREIPDDLVEEEGGSRHGDQFDADSISTATWSRRSEGARYGVGNSFRRDFASADTAGGTAPVTSAQRRGTAFARNPNSLSKDQKRGLDYRQLAVGDRVRHERLGIGAIEKIVPFSGDAILEIRFKSGAKRFKASMSLLTTVED